MVCIVPVRTAGTWLRPLSEAVVMPAAFSASRTSRIRAADRTVTPMAWGSRPAESHERTRSVRRPNSSVRLAACHACGRGPCMGER